MEIKGMVHCLFEQSGTFKNEFRKLGYKAEDYDIQNSFGETEHIIDLFAEIEKGYDNQQSIFDTITPDDLVFAFFPCIKFCSVMEQMQHEDFYDASQRRLKNFGTRQYYQSKWETLRRFSQDRFFFYDIALKMTAIMQIRGLRMIMENPWHPTNFTNHFFFLRPSVIDKNRTLRGDYFVKPTAYWYIGCKPTFGKSYTFVPNNKIKKITAGSGAGKTKRKLKQKSCDTSIYLDHYSQKGLCDKERSMISPDYARNFICDFIIGKQQTYSQQMLFDINK